MSKQRTNNQRFSNPIDRLKFFITRLESQNQTYLKRSDAIELFATIDALKEKSGLDLLHTIQRIELIYDILVDKEIDREAPPFNNFTDNNLEDYEATDQKRMAAYEKSAFRECHDAASDLSVQLDQLRIWLRQDRANNLYYVNHHGEIISAAGRDPDTFVEDITPSVTIAYQRTTAGVRPIIEHSSIITTDGLADIVRRHHYDSKTLMYYERVAGVEKTGMGLRVDREDGLYFEGIPLPPEDFEVAKLLGAFKKLFEVMKKTTLTLDQQSMLLEGLEENGDLEEEEKEQMIAAVRQGKFPLSLGNGPRLPSFG